MVAALSWSWSSAAGDGECEWDGMSSRRRGVRWPEGVAEPQRGVGGGLASMRRCAKRLAGAPYEVWPRWLSVDSERASALGRREVGGASRPGLLLLEEEEGLVASGRVECGDGAAEAVDMTRCDGCGRLEALLLDSTAALAAAAS